MISVIRVMFRRFVGVALSRLLAIVRTIIRNASWRMRQSSRQRETAEKSRELVSGGYETRI